MMIDICAAATVCLFVCLFTRRSIYMLIELVQMKDREYTTIHYDIEIIIITVNKF